MDLLHIIFYKSYGFNQNHDMFRNKYCCNHSRENIHFMIVNTCTKHLFVNVHFFQISLRYFTKAKTHNYASQVFKDRHQSSTAILLWSPLISLCILVQKVLYRCTTLIYTQLNMLSIDITGIAMSGRVLL